MTEDARQEEAKSSTATVMWRGHEFTISRLYDDWTVDFLESLEEGKSVGIVRGALGPSQWHVVKDANLTVGELGELAADLAKALGFASAGE